VRKEIRTRTVRIGHLHHIPALVKASQLGPLPRNDPYKNFETWSILQGSQAGKSGPCHPLAGHAKGRNSADGFGLRDVEHGRAPSDLTAPGMLAIFVFGVRIVAFVLRRRPCANLDAMLPAANLAPSNEREESARI
jgi:hypothetical protein